MQKARLFVRTFNTNDKTTKFKSKSTFELHQKTITPAPLHAFYLHTWVKRPNKNMKLIQQENSALAAFLNCGQIS